MIFEEWESWVPVNVPTVNVLGPSYGSILDPMTDECLAWMEEHVGVKASVRQIGDWSKTIPLTGDFTLFYIKDPEKALLFKLTWG